MPLTPDDELARRAGDLLLARGAFVATLETTAGGLLSARLLSVPGASAWFERGTVAYSRRAKQDLAGVDPEVFAEHGAVSPEAAAALARGIRDASGADYAIAESGIAGPQTGRRSAKPVGSVAIAVAGPAGTESAEHLLPGSRVEVMERIAERCLEALIGYLESEGA